MVRSWDTILRQLENYDDYDENSWKIHVVKKIFINDENHRERASQRKKSTEGKLKKISKEFLELISFNFALIFANVISI